MKNRSYCAVDVFAGCGGLTKGIRDAGFRVPVAIEIDPVAARTFRYNNRKTRLIESDVRSVNSSEIINQVPNKKVDLLVGCAPCQGFCSLTAKYAREDPRNELLMEMARLVEGIQPSAVMMENVPGVATRGKAILGEFIDTLRDLGYLITQEIVQMANYGVPQSRRRFVLLAGRGFVIPFPKPTHIRAHTDETALPAWVPVSEVISGLGRPKTLTAVNKNGGAEANNWHVVRDLQPQTIARLRAATPGKTWLSIDENVRPRCHREGYSGFTNTYGRMSWGDVSPTITAGCTTPCKGRFGHPRRVGQTISVREAAILQTFPHSYRFRTEYMDQVCQMIGNAVPPLFAKVVGLSIRSSIDAHYTALS